MPIYNNIFKNDAYFEKKYTDDLYDALKNSGLVSTTDSFDDMCDALAAEYPQYYINAIPLSSSDWNITSGNIGISSGGGTSYRVYNSSAGIMIYKNKSVQAGDVVTASFGWSSADSSQSGVMTLAVYPSTSATSWTKRLIQCSRNSSINQTITMAYSGYLGFYIPVRYDGGYQSYFTVGQLTVTR